MAFDNRVIKVEWQSALSDLEYEEPIRSPSVAQPPIGLPVERFTVMDGHKTVLRTNDKKKADDLLRSEVVVKDRQLNAEYGLTEASQVRKKMPKKRRRYTRTSYDFSKKSILRRLNKYALNHWSFQYPAAGFAGSALWMAIVGASEFVFGIGVGAFTVACGSLIWNRFCRADAFEKDYIEKMQKEIEQEAVEKRQQLVEDLKDLKCLRGVAQLEQFKADYDNLIELLQTKINPEEVTYKRYHGMVQEVYLSGIDNLRKCLTSLMSVSEIDETLIANRLDQLKKVKTDDARAEEEQLKRRLEVRQKQIDKVDDLLIENEKAITKLEETATLIADLDTGLDEGKVNMDDSMADLMRVINRVKKNQEIKETTKS